MHEICIVPWHCDFFDALAAQLQESAPQAFARGDLSEQLIVFPHLRPRKYLRQALLRRPDLPSPCRPPETLTTGQLFARLRLGLESGPLAEAPHRVAQRLDRVAVLLETVRDLQAQSGLLGRLPLQEEERTLFLPWGLRLERLLEEFVRQDIAPQNLQYTEEQVQPFAAELLAQLGDIAEHYAARLEEKGLTTPARDAWRVVQHLDQACDLLEDRHVVLAGLSDIAGLEEKLFHELWRRGAKILLHSDPALASGNAPHWSCGEHAELVQRWKAGTVLCASCTEQAPPQQDLRFCEGFDLHSQLDGLQRELARLHERGEGRTMVVLPDTGLLMPTLHHLPDKDSVNISMGYPLQRSPLARLVDCLLRLQESRRAEGTYYWKDLLECIRHPYLKMLSLPASPETPAMDLRRPFHALETAVRSGQAFFSPLSWEPAEIEGGWRELAGDGDPQELRRLFREVLTACLTAWEQISSLADAAAAIEQLCDLLRDYGYDLWRRFPIDAECLHRMLYNVIPGLGQSSLAHEPLPREMVFALLRQALEDERTPFESDSLEGVQLLGLLETRLLTPENLCMLDLTDDALPGPPGNDPLLPDSLRRLSALPDSEHRERTMAHHFFRLLQGARTVVLFSQKSVESGGLMDDKRLRSRFLEELLWKVEQDKKQLLAPGEPPLKLMGYPVSAPARQLRSIARSAPVVAALDTLLQKGLSPSSLDEYLHCPARFFYSRLCRIQEPLEVAEEGDPMEIGGFVHLALEVYFRERMFINLHPGAIDPEALVAIYLQLLREQDFYRRIPYDQRLMLEKTGPILLRDYALNMPETTIVALETELLGHLELDGRRVPLRGKADRIDLRYIQGQRGALVLDYKTGGLVTPARDFWKHGEMWSRMEAWPDCEAPDSLLPDLAEKLKSVQLPCYCLLYQQLKGETPLDAALVELRNKGKEHVMVDKRDDDSRTAIIEEQTPLLLQFLLRHMTRSEAFAPQQSKRCERCPYIVTCGGGLVAQEPASAV